MTIALVGGTIIDGNGGQPIPDGIIIVNGERIERVGPSAQTPAPEDAQIINAAGKTVMPGLNDGHNHITGEPYPDPGHPLKDLITFAPIRGVAAARKLLDMGFTACRAMGDAHYANVALKQAIDLGIVPGPRMHAVGYSLRVMGNTRAWITPEAYARHPGLFTGPWEAREAVRMQLLNGANFIETQTAGAVGSNAPTPLDIQEWTMEELEAAADEAHQRGVRICANCYSDDSVERCARAGFDAIEHGCMVTERGIAAMVERDVFMVPTLCAYYAYLAPDAEQHYPAWRLARGRLVASVIREHFAKYTEMGLKVVGGSDGSGPGSGRRPGEGAKELELMVEYGMTPMQAIVANTKMGADVVGLLDQFGTLEPGKLADIIVVDGDPLADITILQKREKIQLVMKGGDLFRSDL